MCQAIKTKSYKHESQWSCRSELSKKSAENTLGGVCEFRGARTIPPLLELLSPPTIGMSSQSMPSKVGSSKSRLAGWGEKLRSLVSIGDGGWSRILEVLSIWLWRSSINVNGPSGSTPRRGAPVVLSRKSSRRPVPEQGLSWVSGSCWEEAEMGWCVGGERWSREGGGDGVGGLEWRSDREGSWLALNPDEISEKEERFII